MRTDRYQVTYTIDGREHTSWLNAFGPQDAKRELLKELPDAVVLRIDPCPRD
jgi:hypothetical protein